MKNPFLLLIIILPVCLMAQTGIMSRLSTKKSKVTVNNIGEIKDAHWAGERTVLHTKDDPSKIYMNTIKILDSKGKQRFSRDYIEINKISVSMDGNRILIPHKRANDANTPYYVTIYDAEILDSLGNTFSKIENFSTPHLKLSTNGKYAITTKVGGADNEGIIQLFDLINNSEIKVQLPILYQLFLADFCGKDHIVIIIQPSPELIRDKETRKILKQVIQPAILYYYKISSRSILWQRELKASDGNKIWFKAHSRAKIKASKNGKYIAIAANYLPVEQKDPTKPQSLFLFSESGTLIKEILYDASNNYWEGIVSINFIEDEFILTEDYSNTNSRLIFYETKTFNHKWTHDLGPKVKMDIIEIISNDKKNILIHSKKRLLELDIENGRLQYEYPSLKVLKINKKSKAILIDTKNSVQYFDY